MNPSERILMQGAEPFYAAGGETGCLCLHGFTASPSEVRWLGQYLADCGHTVYAPRLAGHGTGPRDLARTQWRDWLASAADGVYLLRATCTRIIVVGHSMGGLLALLLASQLDITGIAVLATPIVFSERVKAARWLRYIRPFTDQSDTSPLQTLVREEQARRGEPVLGRVRYDLWSTAAVAQLTELAKAAEQALPKVTCPTLLIYAQNDQLAPPTQAEIIATRVRSKRIEKHILGRSGHIVPQDIERDSVFAEVGKFVACLNEEPLMKG